MANIIKRVWNQNRMVQIEDLKGMTFQAEQAGHTFEISGIDDAGNTVALTGTPAGVFLRPDNTDVALTCSVSGGKVSATLPANCYDVPGRFAITIFITSGGSKTAIYAAIGTVSRTSSGTAAPGTTQSVVDLINAINAAINSIPASYSSLLADIAPDYSNSALYSVGQYAWYDGDLKRCIVPITTAESYTAAHWTSAVLGQDVSDLKSALGANTDNIWVGNPSYSFTRRASITGISIPAGTYTISAIITTPDQTATESEVVFVNASAQDIVKVQLDRNYQAYKTFTLTKEAIALYLYSVHKNDSTGITGTWSNIMLFAGEVREDYTPVFSAKDFVARNKNTKQDDVISGYINLFNPDDTDIVTGSFISKIQNGEETWNTLATVGETGYIPVNTGDRIIRLRSYNKTDCELDDGNPIACYDSSKNPVSYIPYSTVGEEHYITIPTGIAYIRVVFLLAAYPMIFKLHTEDLTPYAINTYYIPYGYDRYGIIEKMARHSAQADGSIVICSQWNGKIWYAYGTSITANNGQDGRITYVAYLAEMAGLTATNKGLGGKGIGTWGNDPNGEVYSAICNITDGKLDADLITLETGANDTNEDVPLGTIYDTGRETLAGCLNDCLRYLQENTNAQIAVTCSPANSTVPNLTDKYYEWATMVEEICHLNRVHFMNADNNMGIGKLSGSNKTLYRRDNIHQTDLGAYIMAENLWYQLRNIPLFYTAIPN